MHSPHQAQDPDGITGEAGLDHAVETLAGHDDRRHDLVGETKGDQHPQGAEVEEALGPQGRAH